MNQRWLLNFHIKIKFNMTFNSENAGAKKKSFNDLTIEFYPFWKPLFEKIGESNPAFKSKLCYNSAEFIVEGEKQPAIRFFQSELNSGHDMYIELCNWDYNFYEPMFRKLYKLKADPTWETQSDKYVQSNNARHVTYAVKLADLELVNETSITKATPQFEEEKEASSKAESTHSMEEEDYSDLYREKEDAHPTTMTMRDKYCMIQNVPLTNKPWLNDLIKQGREWQKKNQ